VKFFVWWGGGIWQSTSLQFPCYCTCATVEAALPSSGTSLWCARSKSSQNCLARAKRVEEVMGDHEKKSFGQLNVKGYGAAVQPHEDVEAGSENQEEIDDPNGNHHQPWSFSHGPTSRALN